MFLFLCVALCVFGVWGGETEGADVTEDPLTQLQEQERRAAITTLNNHECDPVGGQPCTDKCLVSKAPGSTGVVTCFPIRGIHEDWKLLTYSTQCALDFYPKKDSQPGWCNETEDGAYTQPVYSMWDGDLVHAYHTSSTCGKNVRIKHKPEQSGLNRVVYTDYCHLETMNVKDADNDEDGIQVKAGQYLGISGASGDKKRVNGNDYWKDRSNILCPNGTVVTSPNKCPCENTNPEECSPAPRVQCTGSHLHFRIHYEIPRGKEHRDVSIPETSLIQWPIFGWYFENQNYLYRHGHQDTTYFIGEPNPRCKNNPITRKEIYTPPGFDTKAGPQITYCSDGTIVTPPDTCPPGTTIRQPPPFTPPPRDINELIEDKRYETDAIGVGKHIVEKEAPLLKPCTEASATEDCLCDCTDREDCKCPPGKTKARNDRGEWVCRTPQLKLQVDWMPLDGQDLAAVSSPGEVVNYLFRLTLYIGIILAFLSLLVTGIMYILSSAAPALRRQALSRVRKIFTGLVILLLAYIILGFINTSITQTGIPSLSEQANECSIGNETTAIPPSSHTHNFEQVGQYSIMPIGRIIRDFYVTVQVEKDLCTEEKIEELPEPNNPEKSYRQDITSLKTYLKFYRIQDDDLDESRSREDYKTEELQKIALEDIGGELGLDEDDTQKWIDFAKNCGNLPYIFGGIKPENYDSTSSVHREPDKWGIYPSSTLLSVSAGNKDDLYYGGIKEIIADKCGVTYCRPPDTVTCKEPQPSAYCRTDTVCVARSDPEDNTSTCTQTGEVRRSCSDCGYLAAACCTDKTVSSAGYENTCSGNVFDMEKQDIYDLIDEIEEYNEKDLVDIANNMEKARKKARECEEGGQILYSCASLQAETGNLDDYNCDKLYIKDIGGDGLNLEARNIGDFNNELHFFCGNAANNHIHRQSELKIGALTQGPVFNDESDSIIIRETGFTTLKSDNNTINIQKHLANIHRLLNTIKGRSCNRTETNMCSQTYNNCAQPTPQCVDYTEKSPSPGDKACEETASEILDTTFDLGARTEGNAKLTRDLREYQQTMLNIIQTLKDITIEIQNDEIAARTQALIFSTNKDIEEYLQDQCGDDVEDCEVDEDEIQKKLEKLDQELPYVANVLSQSRYVEPARTCVEMKRYVDELKRTGKYVPNEAHLHEYACDGEQMRENSEYEDIEDFRTCEYKGSAPNEPEWLCEASVYCCPSRALEKKINSCEPMDLFKCRAS